jgi:peptide/nickel transport system substrate-binding protein
MDDYWTRLTTGRVTRRRALATTGAGTLGAAFLAACGGSDSGPGGASSSGGDKASNSTITKPEDTLKEAKRGGTLKDRTFGDVSTQDPFTPNNTLNAIEGQVYSSLVKFKPGYTKLPSEQELVGDLAESWETSPDGLTITMKIRQNVKWHNKAPVNGRTFDVDDVLAGWNRFATKFSSRSGIANSADPSAPVLSVTASDKSTIVMKLKEPIFYALQLFASNFTGNVPIMPKESDAQFDPRNDMIGTGPFYLDKYTPSVGFTLKRHPDYWDKDYALVDTVETPIVSEYATALSQFKAGNIYSFGSYRSIPIINPEDVLPTKREVPKILIYQGEMTSAGLIGTKMSFGWLGKSPFLDERVRQAFSMAMDRELYLDTFFNVSAFQKEGLPVETFWNTHLQAEYLNGWLDPKGKDFGENAKYFKRDLTEAKKLLAAAGQANMETTSNYVTGPELGTTPKHAEVIDGFIRELGVKVNVKSLQYANEYIPKFRDGKGQYEGYTYVSTAGAPTGDEALIVLANEYWSKGTSAAFHGFSAGGQNDQGGDPRLDEMFQKGRFERDNAKRAEIVREIQRYLAKPWYAASLPGMGKVFTVAWPALRNFRLWQGRNARSNYQIWVDDTKAPIAKS